METTPADVQLDLKSTQFARQQGVIGRLSARQREGVWFYLIISPWLIGFLVLLAGPMPGTASRSSTLRKAPCS